MRKSISSHLSATWLVLIVLPILSACSTQAAAEPVAVEQVEEPAVVVLVESDVVGLVKTYMWQATPDEDQALFVSRCGGLDFPFNKSESLDGSMTKLRMPVQSPRSFVDYMGNGSWRLRTSKDCVFVVDDSTGQVTGPGPL